MPATDPPLTPNPRRLPGRPAGRPMRTAAVALRHHHFSFVRAAVQLPGPLRDAWHRYLAHEGGPDDERHFAARLREIAALIRQAAAERGLATQAELALGGLVPGPARRTAADATALTPARPALPGLDDWVAERCEALGIEVDFQTQAEWLAEYRAEFGLDQAVRARPATAEAETPVPAAARSSTAPARPLRERLEALNTLAAALSRPPALADRLATWLAPELAARLGHTAVAGRALPLVTLGNLIDFVGLYHHRWWVHVPRLGERRAQRLLAWLQPLAEALGRPLPALALQPLHRLSLGRQLALARLAPEARGSFGLVPLDRLVVPPALSGRDGVYRAQGPNTLGVDTDLAALFAWLRRHAGSPRTHATYGRIVERFYLWCLLGKRKPMSSLNEGDFHDYQAFLQNPPADWVQGRRAGRESAEWRPFKGPLGASSRRLDMTVISGMLSALIEAGYLRANAARGVLPGMKLAHQGINIDRSFDEAQWAWLMQCWRVLYASCGPAAAAGQPAPLQPTPARPDRAPARAAALRRTRLVLELGATTGLRLIELVTTRRSAVSRELVAGRPVWIMKVLGKGLKPREVLLFDDVHELLLQHHADMQRAGTDFDARNARVRSLHQPASVATALSPGFGALPSPAATRATPPAQPDASQLPLVGALRPGPPRWRSDALGVAVLDRDAPLNADRFGSLDPTALYQSLKRFLGRCAAMAETTGAEVDAAGLRQASTHWLRHFFANAAAADKLDLSALKDALGHASLQTTSVYVRAERTRLVGELSRLRRRG